MNYKKISRFMKLIEKLMDLIGHEIPDDFMGDEITSAYWNFIQKWGYLMILLDKKIESESKQ